MQKIGFVAGSFDLYHAGHAAMFRECWENCDYLIVGLQVDPSVDRSGKNKPIESMFERYLKLASVKYIDEIIPYDTEDDLLKILNTQKIDVRFIGEDHKDKPFTGDYLPMEIFWNKRTHGMSTTKIRKRISGAK